jgi:pimeloyl-ACP methyl ester carboxylesterase
MPRLPLAFLPALLLAIACTAGSGADSSPTPTTTPSPDPATPTATPNASLTFDNCQFGVPDGPEVTCGFLVVPEDRSDPGSETIRLAFAVFKSTSDAPSEDAVIYLDGGPGGHTLETVDLSFEHFFEDLLFDRDVVLFDQRGVGFSKPALHCPEIDDAFENSLSLELDEEESSALFVEAASACRDRLSGDGVDLDSYNSAESAHDVADLRRLLRYEQWNLYGISYGTKLGLTIARDHPEGIRSMVLDSSYPLEVDLYVDGPANTVRSLNVLFDQCNADSACAAAYPDLEQVLLQEMQRLQAEPTSADLFNPYTGDVFPGALIDGEALSGTVFQSMYDYTAFPLLPEMIYDVQAENYDTLTDLLGFFLAQDAFSTTGMHLSVQCHEEISFTSEQAIIDAAAQFPPYEDYLASGVGELFETCALWSDARAPAIENQAVVSKIPTLVLAGEWDPITPPRWGADVAANLANSTFVEFPGLGHGVSVDDDCPRSIMLDFLTSPESDLDLSCADGMEEPDFFVP